MALLLASCATTKDSITKNKFEIGDCAVIVETEGLPGDKSIGAVFTVLDVGTLHYVAEFYTSRFGLVKLVFKIELFDKTFGQVECADSEGTESRNIVPDHIPW